MYKHLSFLIILYLLPPTIYAQQNLVSNGDFEDTIKCDPTFSTVTNGCTNWREYTQSSPDYCNSCNNSTTNSVPKNLGGYQYPANGNAYCGILTHTVGVPHYEYIAGKVQPLKPGVTYEVSISVNKSNIYAEGTDNIGVFFYQKGANTIPTTSMLPVKPQVYYSNYGVISDTLNWVRLTSTFIADSAYENLVIGAFNNAVNTYKVTTFTGIPNYAYYYVDSVVVKLFDSLVLDVTDTLLCAGDTVNVEYISTNPKQSGNTFTVQLSNATGGFISPVTIGSIARNTSGTVQCVIPANTATGTGYRMRIIASNYADTAYAYYRVKIGGAGLAKPISGNNGPICDGDTLKLTASSSTTGVNYKWSGPNGFNASIRNTGIINPENIQSGAYIVTTNLYGCETNDTTHVIISKIGDISYPVALSDAPGCVKDTLKLYSNTNNASFYNWKGPDNFYSLQKNPQIVNLTPVNAGDYVLTAGNNYCILNDTTHVTVNTPPDKPIAHNNGPVCTNDIINLNATSTSIAVTYSWTGPDNFVSLQQYPFIYNPTSTHAGAYIVTASLNGCHSKDTTHVIVYPDKRPEGLLATSNGSICINDTLRLYGHAEGTGNIYTWTGPNGFFSNLQNPILPDARLTYSGSYKMEVRQGNCKSEDVVGVIVKPNPKNAVISYNNPACSGGDINLSAVSLTPGVSYQWSGPNNYLATGSTPIINGANPTMDGNYIVTTELNGCTVNDTLAVIVKPTPSIPVISHNAPICAGETLTLTAVSATPDVTYAWTGPNNFTNNSQNSNIINATTNMSGNYTVTTTKNGCSVDAIITVSVKPSPTAITASNNGPLCAGSTLNLSSTATLPGATYSWTGPNSFVANTQSSNITNSSIAASGWYKMLVNLNGCTYTDSTEVTVHPIPAKPVITYNSPLCIGETLKLNTTNINGATYNWTGPNGFSSPQAFPVRSNIQPADAGMYNLHITVNGCTSPTESTHVNINALPFVVILSNPFDSICKGDLALFTAIPNNFGGVPAYQWYVNGQPSGSGITLNSTALNDQDIINCTMTENTKCSVPYIDASNDITMTVLPWLAPSVSITANPSTPLKENEYVTFTATPINAGINPNYQWKKNGQNIVGATSNKWSANTLQDNDVITVEIHSKYKCPQPISTGSNGITVRVLVDIDDVAEIRNLTLYPNPNKGSFIIKGTSPGFSKGEEIHIKVINQLGQVIYSNTIQPKGNEWQKVINLDAPAGIYMLRLNSEYGNKNLKLNLER